MLEDKEIKVVSQIGQCRYHSELMDIHTVALLHDKSRNENFKVCTFSIPYVFYFSEKSFRLDKT